MRFYSPFVWLAFALVACLGLLSSPAMAQFTIVDGPNIFCLEDPDGVDNDTIDAAEDSVRITVTMTGEDAFCDIVEVIFNPNPGFGVLPVAATTFPCPTGDITGYPMTIMGGIINLPGPLCQFTAEITIRPENICIDIGDVIQFDLAARGTDTSVPPPNVQCGQFTRFPLSECNICISCGVVLYEEWCGIFNDGIIAIGDSVWLDSILADAWDVVDGGDTVYADFRHLTCNILDSIVFGNDTVQVSDCDLENDRTCDTIYVIHATWDAAGGETFPADAVLDTVSICARPTDNIRPDIDTECFDSVVVINGNYVCNDDIAGCFDTLRFYFSPEACGSLVPFACGPDINQNHDVTYIGVWFGHWIEDIDCEVGLDPPPPDFMFPMNNNPVFIHCIDSVNGANIPDSAWWLSPAWDTTLAQIYIDVPINSTLWDSITACLDGDYCGDIGDIHFQFIDDAGNSDDGDEWLGDFDNFLPAFGSDICIDNIPPPALGTEPYYDDAIGVCNKRFSPYDSLNSTEYTNISPDSIRWYLDPLTYDPSAIDSFDWPILIGFDVRQEPDEDGDTTFGSIITELNWLFPSYHDIIVGEDCLDTLTDSDWWDWRDLVGPGTDLLDSACFTWYGKDGTDSNDADLATISPCPYGALIGITLARYTDAGGCNFIMGSDHDGMTDIAEGYSTLNIMHAVVDTCKPTFAAVTDSLHFNPALPAGSPYGGTPTCIWDGPNGVADNPNIEFRARRWFTQGLTDTCLKEWLYYRVRLDTVDLACSQSSWDPADSVFWYTEAGVDDDPNFWANVPFVQNSFLADTVTFEWFHDDLIGDPLPDGLYRITLELRDNAGNVCRNPKLIYLNGAGPCVDSLIVTGDTPNQPLAPDCKVFHYVGDTLCVWFVTDSTADSALFDWSCVEHFTDSLPDLDSVYVTSYINQGDTLRIWEACIVVRDWMVDTTAGGFSNTYWAGYAEATAFNCAFGEFILGVRFIGITLFDGGFSTPMENDPLNTGPCYIAVLGLTACPRIIPTTDWFYYYDPDSVEIGAAGVDPEFADFDTMPDWWNAISPGSIDSMGGAGSYDSRLNPARDTVQDSIFVRLLLDSSTVSADTTDTLVLQFYNPTNTRIREIRKALFHPLLADMIPDPTIDNTIFDGMIERDDVLPGVIEFRYYWNGTWFEDAGVDSLMLVRWREQDTIIVRAFTIEGDSIVSTTPDTTYLICDTLSRPLDVDNENPFYREWTGQAPGTRDWETGTTPTVLNNGVNGDCGRRYEDGEAFSLTVKASELVHMDPTEYPNSIGSTYPWTITRDWQISCVDPIFGNLMPGVVVWLDTVEVNPINSDSVYYTLKGYFDLPDDWEGIQEACFVIRGAWDQAGNPGRYNDPVFTDAYEDDSFEDTTFCMFLIECNREEDCPLVWGRPDGIGTPDSVLGWIAAEEDSIIVCAKILETCETALCPPGPGGVPVDSVHVAEGNFQAITDDPNPWVIWNDRSDWFLCIDSNGTASTLDDDTLGWARNYYWWLRADSADLATIHCDGTYLPFEIHFTTYGGGNEYLDFPACVQVDVNEPRWRVTTDVYDSAGFFDGSYLASIYDDRTAFNELGTPFGTHPTAECIDPREEYWLIGYVSDDYIDYLQCGNIGNGVGIDTAKIWADLTNIYMNADSDNVRPDTMWYVPTDPSQGHWACAWYIGNTFDGYDCLNDTFAIVRFHAGYDSLGHHDRELYWQDTLNYCSDCLPPEVAIGVFCDCDSMYDIRSEWEDEGECTTLPLQYVHPGGEISILACVNDPNHDSSMGLSDNPSDYKIDLSQFDPGYGWVTAGEVVNFLPVLSLDNIAIQTFAQFGGGSCNDDFDSYYLNEEYENGDTVKVRFCFRDLFGNYTDTTIWHPAAIVDTLRAIVDFVYTIGDDSVRAYVTPGDQHVNIWADVNGYVEDLVSHPNYVWVDMSRFWCDVDSQAKYDTVYADFVEQLNDDTFRVYWGWYPGVLYADDDDTTTFLSNHYGVDPLVCACADIGAEGTFDTLFFHVTDAACNETNVFSVFEFSGCDTTVPDVDSVWVMGVEENCAPGWFRGQVGDTIEVWAWMDSLFNGFEDTLRIDSVMAELTPWGPSYAWTEITDIPTMWGGAPVYGVTPDWTQSVPSYWDIEEDCEGRLRLVAKWLVVNEETWDCGEQVTLLVKSQRQTGLNGSHGYYLDTQYGTGEAFTATYDWSVLWGDFTHVTGFPGDPDHNGIDSVIVLQNSVYALDWDSTMTVSVLMNSNCIGDSAGCVYDWYSAYIDFTGFLDVPWEFVDTVYCNVDGNNTDSLVWYISLYDSFGGGAVFDETIASDQYWFPLWLSFHSDCDPFILPEDVPFDQFCLWEDLDSVIYVTIQNNNQPNPGMILICDSLTDVCDEALGDMYNMDLWNLENPFNGISSPDTERENLYKVYTNASDWRWFSHEDSLTTRFFVFVEDSVLQCDGVDNDADGFFDELGEGVDFYTADLRINTMPQVAHVDSMNVDGVWINYLWYADNFSEHEYQVDLFISDIYGHRDTLACGDHALVFWEDESCPRYEDLGFYFNGERTTIRVNQTWLDGSDLPLDDLTADDSLFIFSNFDSLELWIDDRFIFTEPGSPGSGVDLSIDNSIDSSTFNGTDASTIRLIGPDASPVAGFTQTFYDPYEYFREGPLTLTRPTDVILPDGWYTIEITTLDRMGNACDFSWSFILDQTCPTIVTAFTTQPGLNTPVDSLWSSWDYVEIIAHVEDSLDGIDSVSFEYAFDANRDGNVDAYSYWQSVNILGANGGANWDTEYPFAAYWNIRNLPWSSEDTLGLPPVNPDGSCTNTYFVRTHSFDIYGHECIDTFTVYITDDIGPVAGIFSFRDYFFDYGPSDRPQGSVVQCFNPNTMTDSTMEVCAWDLIAPGLEYDPVPGDSFTNSLRWFDSYEGIMQYKFFEAPNVYIPGNDRPDSGWVVVQSGNFSNGQDTIVARDDVLQNWCVNLNMAKLTREMAAAGQTAHQFNIRFVAFDVCGNFDELNTPVATFRVECDTTAPLAVICWPEPDMCVTNYRCDSTGTEAWVPVKASVPIFSDVDSLAFFFVDSVSLYPNPVHTFIGGATVPDSTDPGFAEYYSVRWNTDNLISGTYYLYAVAWDEGGLYDTSPIWQPVYVDNTPPQVTECWVADPDSSNEFNVIYTIGEGYSFALRANASDNGCGLTGVQFQYLDRYGNWRNLEDDNDAFWVHGSPDIEVSPSDGFDTTPSAANYYEAIAYFTDFGDSPLDSMRFRAYAIDDVSYGNDNWGGDLNRDCNLDRDQECDDPLHAVCCMALEIRDEPPFGTNVTCWNHGVFAWALPQFAESYQITDGEIFSTCNFQHPLDTLIVTATVHDEVEDGWLMHFKYRRTSPETGDWAYIPNDQSLNPAIPAFGPIPLINTWDSVYVVWSGVRGFIDSADVADGFWYSTWEIAAYVTDVTGNEEPIYNQNSCNLNFVCMPKAPITSVSYVQNDVSNPDNRIRVTTPVSWTPATADTIEVLYNRMNDDGYEDPDALVLFNTDADWIRNCRGDTIQAFNIQLWNLETGEEWPVQVCWPDGDSSLFENTYNGLGYDQYPPDGDNANNYQVGLYFNNDWEPGVYNFAMIVRTDDYYPDFAPDGIFENDNNLNLFWEEGEATCIDIVVRVVNVNEPQIVFCTPEYGDHCGATGTVPLTAHLVENPYFFGEVDTVWFQWSQDNVNWFPVVDPATGRSYDADPDYFTAFFEIDEHDAPGMAGWYYQYSGTNDNPIYDWYAERDLFPDVAVYIWETDEYHQLYRADDGKWSTYVTLETSGGDPTVCYSYSFVIDANDNNIWEEDGIDRWIDDPQAESCLEETVESGIGSPSPWISSEYCVCPWAVNFNSLLVEDGSYNFRTIVGWHDEVAYHVIENPSYGDSVHTIFVDNTIVEDGSVPAEHDIEFDRFYLAGGMLFENEVCNAADTAWFVTNIQTQNGGLVVEDICKVIYQVSLTDDPFADSSWTNVYTVYSNDDEGWTEAWPGWWVAYNPVTDDIDNDGDGLVDETWDVQAGDQLGEENSKFWSRSVVVDYCGNFYYSNAESLIVDVSQPEACISEINGDESPDNSVVLIPADRLIHIHATDQSYADQSILGVFQYRTLNPIGAWTNIQADSSSNDTARHDGDELHAIWNMLDYFNQDTVNHPDPEGWYQLRVIAIDTVWNDDLCDNVVCQVTVRLNDAQPAPRIEIYQITNSIDTAYSCTYDSVCYIMPYDPYCIQAIFAATNIDTGIASLTFQYQALTPGGEPSNWRNIETIYDHLDYGSDGDTTACVEFQPQPQDIGDHGFNIRVIVEDYNGNDTSIVKTLYADGTPPDGASDATPTILVDTYCGDRCRLDNDAGIITAIFAEDLISGEVNVDSVWLTVIRDDSVFSHNFGILERIGDSAWVFDFGGELCEAWIAAGLDMGCYHMTIHFNDCAGNVSSHEVTTDCGFGDTTLVCIDCTPDLPDHSTLDDMEYRGWDCAAEDDGDFGDYVNITDNVLDGTTEVGNQTVEICGELPDYQQYVWGVQLWGQLGNAEPVLLDSIYWVNTSESHGQSYCFDWDVAEQDSDWNYIYGNGHWHLWVLAIDAICQQQSDTMADNFWLYVDNETPLGTITQINGVAPNPAAPDTIEILSGNDFDHTDDETFLWVEWTDGLTPDDSTQAHNQVQLWCKDSWHPNQADSWVQCGYIPSICNPHYIIWTTDVHCNAAYDIVATVRDRWGNGDLDVEEAMAAYDAGRFIDVYIRDTTPPATQLWALNWDDTPDCDEEAFTRFDQQSNSASWSGAWGHDVWLHAFGAQGDYTIERVYFEYSLDGTTWFEIATDENADWPAWWDCEECVDPQPWWCDSESEEDILWTAYWDIAGLSGDVWVRVRGEDECGNIEDWEQYVVSIDVQAPMARVFVWESDLNVDDLPCEQWTEEQISDSLERFTLTTLGACPEQENYDAYGSIWWIKRADDNALSPWHWCYVADDSTGPFSYRQANLWNGGQFGNCPETQPGTWYDIAVLTTDQSGNELTWTQFVNYGNGTTYLEKWQDLINRGYVKRFLAVDHVAPVAHSLTVTPDQTPDSSEIFVTGNVNLSAYVDEFDVVATTWATIEQGAPGPWTIIERVEGLHSDTVNPFNPLEGYWNTELLNGTYWIGAFAEDDYGNMDGNTNLGPVTGAPSHPLLVHVDNQPPTAVITQITRDENVVSNLERGAWHTFFLNATDNFGLRQVQLYYRHHGGDPDDWHMIGTDTNFPYSFNWRVPADLVAGWEYDFAAVATDLVWLTDMTDGQNRYIVDGTWQVVDNEASISITTIGGVNAETTPHLNGTQITIVAESEPYLDNVRFLWRRGVDEVEIGTISGPIGQTTWTLSNWDVTTLSEGPAQLCAIGSADQGGHQVTLATDCRNIIIDHSAPAVINGNLPLSHGLVGGECFINGYESNYGDELDDIWVTFNVALTDQHVDTVWFEWKDAQQPDEPGMWSYLGISVRDQLSGRWSTAYDFTGWNCGTITLRAKVSDNAVPTSNEALIIFADSIRVDNCEPVLNITNINGDVTPEGTEIPQGQVAVITATAFDQDPNGGFSAIDSVCFYYYEYYGGEEYDFEDLARLGCASAAPYQISWNTGGVPFGEYTVVAIAWDHAGNCASHLVDVQIIDQLYQRAWIVGYDLDNGLGCLDKLYAVTDDCPPNWTTSVVFQYSINGGQSWVALGEDNSGEQYCDEWLDYNIWSMSIEFDAIPQNAIFRTVAYDESGNQDPTPPRWQLSDVSVSATPVIFNDDIVRVPVTEGQVPWVFATLEDYTESCLTNGGLVCVEQTEGDPTRFQGPLPSNTDPCLLNNRDGQVTVFRATTTQRGGQTFVIMVKYEMNIHRVDQNGGSNGMLTSEDLQLQMIVPNDGVTGNGTVWFEPSHDNDNVNLIPPQQYYYTLLSEVETVYNTDFSNGSDETRFRMTFNPALLPPQPDTTHIVAAYWDDSEELWVELGIVYEARNLVAGRVDFHWIVDWNVSYANDGCPDEVQLAVFYSTVQNVDRWVRFSDGNCESSPDSTYWNAGRGPTVACHTDFWTVLREGEFTPPESEIDVYLDGVRIVNDGEVAEICGNTFRTMYDQVSGIYTIQWTEDSYNEPPYYGCLSAGQHNIRIWANNISTNLTPFFVDVTGPEVFMTPGYINHDITLVAYITDPQSGVDIDENGGDQDAIQLDLSICADPNQEYVHVITQEAMTFEPIENGYRVSVHIQWSAVEYLFFDYYGDDWYDIFGGCENPPALCAHWHVDNQVCLDSDESHDYQFTLDSHQPYVTAVSPIGAPIDNNGDGEFNEDPIDCLNNDNDVYFDDNCDCWVPRFDEDPIDFVADTINCGEKLPISAAINDLAACCNGASGVNMRAFRLWIDGREYAASDTNNPALNFHIFWNQGLDDAVITWGGELSGEVTDFAYTPGQHTILVNAPDSVGNVGSQGFAWTYYVRCSGPSITFEQQDCGNWFNPEGQNSFAFWVQETAGQAIATNGISYRAFTQPDSLPLWAWTTIDPNGRDSVHVNYDLSGSFPDGQTALTIEVVARNIRNSGENDTEIGYTHSAWTWTVDNYQPTLSAVSPTDGETFTRDQAIVVEVVYTDDHSDGLQGGGSANSVKPDASAVPMMKVGRMGADGQVEDIRMIPLNPTPGISGRRDGALDDNGSGIIEGTIDMNIYSPSGENIGPANTEEFDELDEAHAKYIIPAGGQSGPYTVNVRIEDCVGNIGVISWNFEITSQAPGITFNDVEGECRYQNYWNPNSTLPLSVTVRELDNVNVTRDGIRIDVVRMYNCDGGLCSDTVLFNGNFNMDPASDPNNRSQVFTISSNYNFDSDIEAVELRLLVSVTNTLGATGVSSQSWIVDGQAPIISIVSPQPDQVLPEGQAVTISADFTDEDEVAAIITPGGKFNKNMPGINTVGPTRATKSKSFSMFGGDSKGKLQGANKIDLGDWTPAISGHDRGLDGASGVNPACVELLLRPGNGDPMRRLSDEEDRVIITENNITWVGPLSAGSYTIILSVCDEVCNTSNRTWSFAVTPSEAGITYLPPFYVSSMPHTFDIRVDGPNVDYASAQIHVECMQTDSLGQPVWTTLTDNANWTRDENLYHHTGNYDLGLCSALRLTMHVDYTYGVPVPGGSQIYTVDTEGPQFTGVTPAACDLQADPPRVIAIGTAPTFVVNFIEVGNTQLDGESVRVRLYTEDGALVDSSDQVWIDEAGTSGWAQVHLETGLAEGRYTLSATVSDLAGNSTSMIWDYCVGTDNQTITDGEPYNWPNPFEPGDEGTHFVIPVSGATGVADLEIKIYDWAGNFVATVYDGPFSANDASNVERLTWYGTNDNGDQVANGVYLAHVHIVASGEAKDNVLKVAFKNAK